jgi:hypothetical protein
MLRDIRFLLVTICSILLNLGNVCATPIYETDIDRITSFIGTYSMTKKDDKQVCKTLVEKVNPTKLCYVNISQQKCSSDSKYAKMAGWDSAYDDICDGAGDGVCQIKESLIAEIIVKAQDQTSSQNVLKNIDPACTKSKSSCIIGCKRGITKTINHFMCKNSNLTIKCGETTTADLGICKDPPPEPPKAEEPACPLGYKIHYDPSGMSWNNGNCVPRNPPTYTGPIPVYKPEPQENNNQSNQGSESAGNNGGSNNSPLNCNDNCYPYRGHCVCENTRPEPTTTPVGSGCAWPGEQRANCCIEEGQPVPC